jgi:large subunit ribosomal protein L23
MREASQVIVRPLLTEKSARSQEIRKYVFEVARNATKIEIRAAIEELGKTQVAAVNTLTVKGKPKRVGRRVGRTPDWKKAIVTLKPGAEMEGLLKDAFGGV